MASYMPQDLFDMVVATAVKLHMSTGDSLDHICTQILKSYRSNFPDDADLDADIKRIALELLKLMRSQFNNDQLASVMTQLQFCIIKYDIDGTKKRKRLFGGTWFTRSRSPIPNRANDCLRNMIVYHTGTISGMFPIAPAGWSLHNR